MKILVISDTHQKIGRVFDIWPKLKNIDLIAHAGDHYADAMRIGETLGVPVISVAGNCDSGRGCVCEGEAGDGYYYASYGDYGIIETEYGRILLTHGHKQHVSYDLSSLGYLALENDCCMAIFGHTHCGLNVIEDDVRFLNPGSLTQPRDGSGGSYAIVRTSEDRLDASIVYYNTVMGASAGGSGVEGHGGHGGASSNEKAKSSDSDGLLKSLLNYCDRF